MTSSGNAMRILVSSYTGREAIHVHWTGSDALGQDTWYRLLGFKNPYWSRGKEYTHTSLPNLTTMNN